MKFIVAQIGARRGYAVPAILERAGMLERFYTDICADHGAGRWLAKLGNLGPTSIRRLAARRVPATVRSKTFTFSAVACLHLLRSATQNGDPLQHYHEGLRLQQELGHDAADVGFGSADALYCMMDEFGPLLASARAAGLKVVSELYILLSTDRIMNRERKDFPGWEDDALDYDSLDRQTRPNRPLFTAVDCAICPSETVRDDAVQNFGFVQSRTAVVPYGVNPELLALRNQPVPGRVVFAGTAELRKGIHYFAMAAEQLRGRGFKGEFRVAGNVSSKVLQQPICRHLQFLGRVPRAEMARQFSSADVLALPSLAEGSAEVTYEALACGVPVITTPEAGSVVRDRVEGRIVPSRDPVALADAIAEIVENRGLRDQMAHNARERARDYTWERYGERLIAALTSFKK